MKCVILVAGIDERLEREVRSDQSEEYKHLVGIPKALFPDSYSGNTLLDNWWEAIRWAQTRTQFSGVYLVTNAEKFKHYDRWTTTTGFPRENVVNDGTTSSTGGIGALADFDLCVRSKKLCDDHVMVVAGDMLCNPKRFDIMGICSFFKTKEADGDMACYYEMHPGEDASSRGIIEVDPITKEITGFVEKPAPNTEKSRNASIVFYIFRKETLFKMRTYLHSHPDVVDRSFGKFMEWLVPQQKVYGMKLPDIFDLIGSVSLKEYEMTLKSRRALRDRKLTQNSQPIDIRVNARVGVLGNPSDGFFGKTISLSIQNFWAEVTIVESSKIELIRHPLNDPTTFGSLADLHSVSVSESYLGGLRLMQATCKKFYEFCTSHGIAIPRRNFTLSYDTNIPRQVGLAGSSAIVTATFKCLMQFFKLTERDIRKELQPNFVLEVEKQELGINAGLQDRVIQIYGGLVYMDFSKELLDSRGYGDYAHVHVKDIPQFYLAYLADPSDSGKIHNNVRQRFDKGDEEAIAGMKTFADIAAQGKVAFEKNDMEALADLMDKNFTTRRELYTDPALGDANILMVETAKKHNAAAKFSGSGGAVIVLPRSTTDVEALKEEMNSHGFVFVKIIPSMETQTVA